jgi:phosphoserine phosphatase
MIGAAGLGVAFHAKPVVAAMAPAQIRFAGLRALRFVQGI